MATTTGAAGRALLATALSPEASDDLVKALSTLLHTEPVEAATNSGGKRGKKGRRKKSSATPSHGATGSRRGRGGARGKGRTCSKGKTDRLPDDASAHALSVPLLMRAVSDALGPGASAVMEEVAAAEELGWDAGRLLPALQLSPDRLRVWKRPDHSDGYAGAVGARLYVTGRHCFAVRVSHPVDDAYWVGVAYADARLELAPKRNARCIVWSGGSVEGNRPGTLRVHGEKFRNQPQFRHGDVVGVVVDLDCGDIEFWHNTRRVMHWPGVLRGPVTPCLFFKHADGPAGELLQWARPIPPPPVPPAAAATAAAAVAAAGTAAAGAGAGATTGGAGAGAGAGAAPGPAASDRTKHVGSTADRDVKLSGDGVEPLPTVDGSLLEGGGQVLRVALACGALLGRPLIIHSIRARRSNPGLGHQHSTGAKLVADMCGGALWPDALQYGGHCAGTNDLRLWPGVRGLRGGDFLADTHTAGAVTLLLQASLPCALLAGHDRPIHLVLRGGTNVAFSPPIDYLRMVLVPLLEARCGVPKGSVRFTVGRRGFYPRGCGEVTVDVTPTPAGHRLRPITMVDRGVPVAVEGVVYGGGTGRRARKSVAALTASALTRYFGDGVAVSVKVVQDGGVSGKAQAMAALTAANRRPGTGADGTTMTRKQRLALSDARAARKEGVCGCQLVLRTSTGCLIPGDSLLEQAGKRAGSGIVDPREVAAGAVARLTEAWEAGGAVCEYTMDQLVVFMALADGRSRVLCPGPTSITSLHLETAIHFVSLLTGAKFTLTPVPDMTPEGKKPCVLVECDGIGYGGAHAAKAVPTAAAPTSTPPARVPAEL